MRWLNGHLVKLALLSTGLAACGFSPGPAGEAISGGAASSGNSTGSGNGGGGGGGGTLVITGVGLNGGGGDITGGGGSMTCGVSTTPVMPEPPDILIVQDRSKSMLDNPDDSACNNCPTSKWTQTSTAIESAVMTTQTVVNWGLIFFGSDNQCGTTATPNVPIETNAYADVQSAFGGTQPASYTPTASAVTNAVKYLQGLPASDTHPKYILLATDGLPNCMGGKTNTNDDSQGAITAVGASLTAGFPVFVVGIGDTMGDDTLNSMATAGGEPQTGGTTSFYSVADTASLEMALNKIVGIVASCTIPLTNVPAGQTNVAVSVDDASGKATKVPEDNTDGWSYVNGSTTTIQLNGSYCDGVKGGTYSNVQFVYACDGAPICIDKLADGSCGDKA